MVVHCTSFSTFLYVGNCSLKILREEFPLWLSGNESKLGTMRTQIRSLGPYSVGEGPVLP